MTDLDRFLDAQKNEYKLALKEIKNGKKISCWMWYIFPQIKGLGKTYISNYYGIKDIEEAKEYLNNDLLRKRLIEISQALLELEETDIKEVIGYLDDIKLQSSMTLFNRAEELSDIKCENIFKKVLKKYFNDKEDNKTLAILEKQKLLKQNKNNNSGEGKREDKVLFP